MEIENRCICFEVLYLEVVFGCCVIWNSYWVYVGIESGEDSNKVFFLLLYVERSRVFGCFCKLFVLSEFYKFFCIVSLCF